MVLRLVGDVFKMSLKADFHFAGTDRIGKKEDIPLVGIDVI